MTSWITACLNRYSSFGKKRASCITSRRFSASRWLAIFDGRLDSAEQAELELAAHDRRDLHRLLHRLLQAVDTCLDDVVDGGGPFERGGVGDQPQLAAVADEQFALEKRLSDLLDEQRVAVGLVSDELHELRRKVRASEEAVSISSISGRASPSRAICV